MTEYISRESENKRVCELCDNNAGTFCYECDRNPTRDIPAADVRPVVTCADCKCNNACLTQAFVEDASRVPFDRNTFFCADGKRADDA